MGDCLTRRSAAHPNVAAWMGRDMHGEDLDRIMVLARRLEPNVALLIEWLCTLPISRLDDRTAIELVQLGQGGQVIDLLSSALQEEAKNLSVPVPIGARQAICS